MIPEHQVHPGATEVLDSLEQFDPVKYGLPAFEEEEEGVIRHEDEESRDSVMTNDENSNDSIL